MLNLINRSGKFLKRYYFLFSAVVILQVTFYAFSANFVSSIHSNSDFLMLATVLVALSAFSIGSIYKGIVECQYNDRINWEMMLFNPLSDFSSSFVVRLVSVLILESLVLGLYMMDINVGAYLFQDAASGINFMLAWVGYSLMLEFSMTLLSTRLVESFIQEKRASITLHAVATILISVGVIILTVQSSLGIFFLALLMFYGYIFSIAMMRLNNESDDVY